MSGAPDDKPQIYRNPTDWRISSLERRVEVACREP